ncbi:hypothetical protein ACTFIT_000779 [Dictyostelium discoideum]
MYIQVIKSSWYWVNINIKKLNYFIDTPLHLINACVLLYVLKGGEHGRVWLCCASSGVLEGQVVVFKKFKKRCHIGKYLDCNGGIKILIFDLVLYEIHENVQFIKESMLKQIFPINNRI